LICSDLAFTFFKSAIEEGYFRVNVLVEHAFLDLNIFGACYFLRFGILFRLLQEKYWLPALESKELDLDIAWKMSSGTVAVAVISLFSSIFTKIHP